MFRPLVHAKDCFEPFDAFLPKDNTIICLVFLRFKGFLTDLAWIYGSGQKIYFKEEKAGRESNYE